MKYLINGLMFFTGQVFIALGFAFMEGTLSFSWRTLLILLIMFLLFLLAMLAEIKIVSWLEEKGWLNKFFRMSDRIAVGIILILMIVCLVLIYVIPL